MTFFGIFILALLRIRTSDCLTNQDRQDGLSTITVPEAHFEDNAQIQGSEIVADSTKDNKLSNGWRLDNGNSQKYGAEIKDSFSVFNENIPTTRNSLETNTKELRNAPINKQHRTLNSLIPTTLDNSGKNQLHTFLKNSKPTLRNLAKGLFGRHGSTFRAENMRYNFPRNLPLKWRDFNRVSSLREPKLNDVLEQNTDEDMNALDDNDLTDIENFVRNIKMDENKRIHRMKRSVSNTLNFRDIESGSIPELPKRQRIPASRFYETLSSLVRLKMQMTYGDNWSGYPLKQRILLKPNLLALLNTYRKRKFSSWGGKRDTFGDDSFDDWGGKRDVNLMETLGKQHVNDLGMLRDEWDRKRNINELETLPDTSDLIDQLFDTSGDGLDVSVTLSDDGEGLNGQKIDKRQERQRQRRVFHPWAGK